MTIPGSVRRVEQRAFGGSSLRSVRFLGATEGSGAPLVIGEEAFANCGRLRQVVFDPGSALEEVRSAAFYGSGLRSFAATPSLKKAGAMAFGRCASLRDFRLNEGVRELGWFCLWKSGVAEVHLPPQVRRTREELGLEENQ